MKISREDFYTKMTDLRESDFVELSLSDQMAFLKQSPDYIKLAKIDGVFHLVPNVPGYENNVGFLMAMGRNTKLTKNYHPITDKDLIEYFLEENDISFSLSVL